MNLPADPACPVDLHYAEPDPARLDLPSILARGRRLRRRRRLARAAAGVAACAIIAAAVPLARVASSGLAPGTGAGSRPPGSGTSPIAGMLAVYPPVGGHATLLARWPGHWVSYAWAVADGQLCWAIVPSPGRSGQSGYGEEYCPGALSGLTPGGALQLSVSGVDPYGQPTYRLAGHTGLYYPVAGVVPPQAARVALTIFGRTFTADVARVTLPGRRSTGMFLVWIELPARAPGYRGSFVTGATAYDRAGHVVAQHGSWAPK